MKPNIMALYLIIVILLFSPKTQACDHTVTPVITGVYTGSTPITMLCIGQTADFLAIDGNNQGTNCSNQPPYGECSISSYSWSVITENSGASAISGSSSTFNCSFSTTGEKTVTLGASCAGGYSSDPCNPASVTITVFEMTELNSAGNKTIISTGEELVFNVVTNPTECYNTLSWKKDEDLVASGVGSYAASWTTPGTKTVTVSSGNCSLSMEIEVINGLTVFPKEAYVSVESTKEFSAWACVNGVATDVTSSSTFTTDNGAMKRTTGLTDGPNNYVLHSGSTASSNKDADYVKATYNGNTTDDADQYCKLTVIEVNITDNSDNEITSKTTVSVGQKVDLGFKVEPSGLSSPTDIQWTVPGTRVKDYTIAENNTSASKTDMATGDFQAETLGFYWVTGGDPLEVSIGCTVEGIDCDDDVQFEVQRPVMSYFNSVTDTVSVLQLSGAFTLEPRDNFSDSGMKVNISVTQPTCCWGNYVVVQLCNTISFRTKNDDTIEVLTTNGHYWFDGGGTPRNPYPGLTITYDNFDDSPSLACFPGYKEVSVSDFFQVYLMYMPSAADAIWVPVGRLMWDWYGTAETTDGGVTWTLDNGGALAGQDPSGGYTNEFPEWSEKIILGQNLVWEQVD